MDIPVVAFPSTGKAAAAAAAVLPRRAANQESFPGFRGDARSDLRSAPWYLGQHRSFPRRLPLRGLVAFFVCGLVDGRECEALWQTDTLIIDEPLLDRAMVVEALGETYYLPRLGLSSPCFVDTGQPHVLMLTLVRALDVVHDIRAARADDPDTWMQLVCP